jgi:acyl dehydratase
VAKITFPIEATHILMFARAIGDENPVYHDAEKAKETEAGGIIAPPTFTASVAQFNPDGSRPRFGEKWFGSGKAPSGIEGKAPSVGGLNAEQHFEYFRPVRPGEVLTAETRPNNTWERESKRAGKLLFSDRITDFRDQNGKLVVSVRSVSVRTERPVDPR